jgi:hypothetical protein
MSACARCRWGPGTTTERPPNTENAKQLEGGLAALMAARATQDCTYFPQTNVEQSQQSQQQQPSVQLIKRENWSLQN